MAAINANAGVRQDSTSSSLFQSMSLGICSRRSSKPLFSRVKSCGTLCRSVMGTVCSARSKLEACFPSGTP